MVHGRFRFKADHIVNLVGLVCADIVQRAQHKQLGIIKIRAVAAFQSNLLCDIPDSIPVINEPRIDLAKSAAYDLDDLSRIDAHALRAIVKHGASLMPSAIYPKDNAANSAAESELTVRICKISIAYAQTAYNQE